MRSAFSTARRPIPISAPRAEQARNEATDYKARLDGKDAVITGLREQLDRERDRADRLEAELRRPFWRRWFG
jgi:hypothetical protein